MATDEYNRTQTELIDAISKRLQNEYSRRMQDSAGSLAELDGEVRYRNDEPNEATSQLRRDVRELRVRTKRYFPWAMGHAVAYLCLDWVKDDAELEEHSGADIREAFQKLGKHRRAAGKLLREAQDTWELIHNLASDPAGADILPQIYVSASDEADPPNDSEAGPEWPLMQYCEILRKCSAALRRQFYFRTPGSGNRGEDRLMNVLVTLLDDIGIEERLTAELLSEFDLTPGKVRSRLNHLAKKAAED